MKKESIQQCPKVSVIIPVYNVEKYIERCVRSLFEQTLEEIEYIFVDDCTPDCSMEILERIIGEYPERSKQIRIIRHKENRGLASARNSGLRIAQGEYIIHCDSDDWVETDMYERLYQRAVDEQADITGCDFYEEYKGKRFYNRQIFHEEGKECIQRSFRGELHCGVWNKLIKRDLYTRTGIFFPDKVDMWEDVVTINRLYYFAGKITWLPQAFYHYVRYNINSYTQALNEKSCENLISAIEILTDFFVQRHTDEFDHSLNYLRLSVKRNLLLNSHGVQQKIWNQLYPEANACIMSFKCMPWYWRIALFFAAHGLLPVFNLLAYIGRWSKSIIN